MKGAVSLVLKLTLVIMILIVVGLLLYLYRLLRLIADIRQNLLKIAQGYLKIKSLEVNLKDGIGELTDSTNTIAPIDQKNMDRKDHMRVLM